MSLLGVVLVVAVVIGFARGGRLANLAGLDLPGWPLLFLAVALQIAAELIPDDRSWSQNTAIAMILGSYVVLLGVLIANRTRPGLWLAGLGILLNFLVIALNGGMPVSAEAASLAGGGNANLAFDAKHVLLDDGSRLAFLADVIPVEQLRRVLSIGDVFLAVGLGRFVEHAMRERHWLRHAGSGRPGSAAGQ